MAYVFICSDKTFLIPFLEKIEEEFQFFPRLHAIFASRPNVTPIVITTALGPQGQKTIWYQPPEGGSIDPQLLEEAVHATASVPEVTVSQITFISCSYSYFF